MVFLNQFMHRSSCLTDLDFVSLTRDPVNNAVFFIYLDQQRFYGRTRCDLSVQSLENSAYDGGRLISLKVTPL